MVAPYNAAARVKTPGPNTECQTTEAHFARAFAELFVFIEETLADRDDAFDNLAVDSQILFTMVDVDVAEAKVLDGISRTPQDASGFHLQGKMNELIIYNSDLSSDRGTIESEIANHYNITLS